MHIDLDGNDYWILESLDVDLLRPDILILEYNATFGSVRLISVRYGPLFKSFYKHYSEKRIGASLQAFNDLVHRKRYYFIGCSPAGNNAHLLGNIYEYKAPLVCPSAGFQSAGFSEARDKGGTLSFIEPANESPIISGLLVADVSHGEFQEF